MKRLLIALMACLSAGCGKIQPPVLPDTSSYVRRIKIVPAPLWPRLLAARSRSCSLVDSAS